MIRIKRSKDEPSALTNIRERQLKLAIQKHAHPGVHSEEFRNTLIGYNERTIKETLYAAQHKKCAWCERKADFSSCPVEHYRPKKGSKRHFWNDSVAIVDDEHYWWLAWTWENLHFSCCRCNDQAHKGNYFPLLHGTKALTPPQKPLIYPLPNTAFDTSTERPLLLNPSDRSDNPLKHIRWLPTDKNPPRETWIWTPRGRTESGKATIRILKLEELSEDVGVHLRTRILRPIEHIEEYLSARRKRLADAQKCWDKLLKDNLAPESELSAATWCALEIWMPAKKRRENGLREPRRPGS